jgi:transcription initiation factor TFIIIB Brf1 subunit/transcription initiation factor TFIIB
MIKKLGCETGVKEETNTLIERADKAGLLSQGTPKGLAAGIVYIACILAEDRMTQDTVGGAIGVSSSVVAKNYMTIARSLGFVER